MIKSTHAFEYEVIQKRTWNGIKDYFVELQGDQNIWIFRGHADYQWKIASSIERTKIANTDRIKFENGLIDQFQRRIHHYLNVEHSPTTKTEWISLMQHHGAHTRLLDWTLSPYIATFFASKANSLVTKYSCVWAINLTKLSLNGINEFMSSYNMDALTQKGLLNNSKIDFTLENPAFFDLITEKNIKIVFPVYPYKLNERIDKQQGIFLFGGDLNVSFEENLSFLGDKGKSCIKQILIPENEFARIKTDLFSMNINSATLFPGIDGFTKHLDEKLIHRFLYNNVKVEEMEFEILQNN